MGKIVKIHRFPYKVGPGYTAPRDNRPFPEWDWNFIFPTLKSAKIFFQKLGGDNKYHIRKELRDKIVVAETLCDYKEDWSFHFSQILGSMDLQFIQDY